MPSLKNGFHKVPTRRSLILAGGGARLSYQAGVLKALEECGLTFNHFDGTSGGIFNTAMICSGQSAQEMTTRWRTVRGSHFTSLLAFKSYFSRSKFTALGDADAIRKKLFPKLGIEVEAIANTNIDATFNVCHFSSKRILAIAAKDVTEAHLIAGVSLPIFMPAIKINNDWFTDAVWIKDANLTEAINRNVNEIWVVWAIGNTREYLNGAFNQYIHMIEMSANGGLLLEFDLLNTYNKQRITDGKLPVALHIVKPKYPLPLDPDFMLGRVTSDELINCGYADAMRYVSKFHVSGVPIDHRATQMKDPGICVNFRAQFNFAIVLDGQKHECILSIAFAWRMVNEKLHISAWASVQIGNSPRISTHSNKFRISGGRLIFNSKFLFDSQQFSLQVQLYMNSPYDLLLGLEFKKGLGIIRKNGGKPLPFLIRQRTANRLKNLLFVHLTTNSGWRRRWREKIRIIKSVYKLSAAYESAI